MQQKRNVAIILQAGPSCRSHTPLPILGKMFNHLASEASVPVVAHLDHGILKRSVKKLLTVDLPQSCLTGRDFHFKKI